MPNPLIRYELDPTGINPDNLVVGEPHNLSDKPVRAIAPTYGPFFADVNTLKVYDAANGNLLQRGAHFQCVELLQDATLQYGKEICSVILIIDPAVSSSVSIDYQTLGGHFSNDSTAIANLYDAVIHDNRPVRWENLISKPVEYPPTLHRHLLEDLYGFEPVVAAIERLRNAILLTDVPAFEALLDLIMSKVNPAKCKDVLTNTPTHGLMSHWSYLAGLTHRYLLSEYRFAPIPDFVREGSAFNITVEAKAGTPDSVLYWEVIHDGTNNSDFEHHNGTVNIQNGVGRFVIQVNNDYVSDGQPYFGIGLKYNQSDRDYMAISCRMRIVNEIAIDEIPNAIDLAIYPDFMSYWNEDITASRVFMSSAKNVRSLVGRAVGGVQPGDIGFMNEYITIPPE